MDITVWFSHDLKLTNPAGQAVFRSADKKYLKNIKNNSFVLL